ncbi:MAG: cytochrome c [Deltaproteobacteria bacterium]|nr:cytochrome c [Deltaproteobacteria bacterium]
MGLMLACRTFKDAQSKEQYAGAVRCADFITAVTAAFSVAACSTAGVPTLASKVAAERILTPSVEEQSGSTEVLARGAKVYATSCQPCHGDRYGKGSIGRAHPHNEKGHTWHHPDAQLKEWILHGKPGPGYSVMPGFTYLGKDDLEAVLAVIKTWWTAEQQEMQADISRRYDQAINKKKRDPTAVK